MAELIDELKRADVKMCESITGNWHYHLCRADGNSLRSLCGKQTMACGAPIDSWGYQPEHMRSSYCNECERIAKERIHE